MKKLKLKEIQNEELKMLLLITRFLKERNIEYFLYGGTMLGAVRHNGFIPWDDDIDIILSRPEYEKFIIELKKKNNRIQDNIYAIGYELGNSVDWPFIKIINKDIVVRNDAKCDKNLWIDVFVYDGIPEKSGCFWKKVMLFRRLFLLKRNIKNNYSFKNDNIKNKIKYKTLAVLLKPFSQKFILMIYLKLCKKDYNKSKYIYDNIWGTKQERKIPKNLLESREFIFEGYSFSGFKNYDKVLKIIYGDYMKIPPKNERCTHCLEAYYIKNKE